MDDWSLAAGTGGALAVALAAVFTVALRRRRRRIPQPIPAGPIPADFNTREAQAFEEAALRRLEGFLRPREFVLESVEVSLGFSHLFFRSPDCRLLVYRDWKRDHEVNALLALAYRPWPASQENGWRYVWSLLKAVDPAAHARMTGPLIEGPHQAWPAQLDEIAALLEHYFPDFLARLRSEASEPGSD
jgi:hypothetical protein